MCINRLASWLDALAPRCCAGCGAADPWALCGDCVDVIESLGTPAPRHTGATTWHAAFPFLGPVRRAVHSGKYRGRRQAIHLLASLAAERLAPRLSAFAAAPAAVVPVPLGPRRRRVRGYNQARVIADVLARLPSGGPVVDGLRRCRETGSQVGRSAAARRRNLDAAFAWAGPPLRPGSLVWLVDDVVTTGATLEAAARALQRAGAGRIEAVAASATP